MGLGQTIKRTEARVELAFVRGSDDDRGGYGGGDDDFGYSDNKSKPYKFRWEKFSPKSLKAFLRDGGNVGRKAGDISWKASFRSAQGKQEIRFHLAAYQRDIDLLRFDREGPSFSVVAHLPRAKGKGKDQTLAGAGRASATVCMALEQLMRVDDWDFFNAYHVHLPRYSALAKKQKRRGGRARDELKGMYESHIDSLDAQNWRSGWSDHSSPGGTHYHFVV